ncbi:hypothetical protein Q7C_1365 [Methylophaga frappieri]|uniref:Uncharacterized protein n=1 Tax=Methylophaga frappieri (strain ATCC BAA-2434 / DSM 25690 / JAM7) TaxID=754477 RepID=I1YHX2_METFJ|nr:hypothetical protein [Methylophaga frappieri]AFJ02515.1 hypothetical protein Q7C_1365 [Methylophaga frappieri]
MMTFGILGFCFGIIGFVFGVVALSKVQQLEKQLKLARLLT